MDADTTMWIAIHRALIAIAKAIDTYKIKPGRRKAHPKTND